MAAEGFSAASSLLYHRHLPTAIARAEEVDGHDGCLADNRPLLPRHFRTHGLSSGADLVTGRHLLLGNGDVRILYATAAGPSPLYRDALGDELLYLEAGEVDLESVFGTLRLRAG